MKINKSLTCTTTEVISVRYEFIMDTLNTKLSVNESLDYIVQKRVVHSVANPGPNSAKYLIQCPGCNCCHGWNDKWGFDGNMDSPTVSPSLLVRGLPLYKNNELVHEGICHSFIRNGQISFLSDCTHSLAGQTVPLEPW
jgi:hypothetical protein